MATQQPAVDTTGARRAQLRAAAERYFAALATKDFEAIPYAETVTLRAPLVPGRFTLTVTANGNVARAAVLVQGPES